MFRFANIETLWLLLLILDLWLLLILDLWLLLVTLILN